jgi:hypothetical protein
VRNLTQLAAVQQALTREQRQDLHLPTLLISGVLIECILTTLFASFALLLVQIAKERARQRREARKRKLPTTVWKMGDGQKYVCFLSHYKVEAGAEARYVKDALDAMLHHLSERLDATSLEQLTTVLSQLSPPHDVTELQSTLAALIPHIMSVAYHGSHRVHYHPTAPVNPLH